MKHFYTLSFLFSFFIAASQNLPAPAEFLGYELGSQFTRHSQVVDYFEEISEKSAMVQLHQYGQTNERRPLIYATISSEENIQNIEEIRQNHLNNVSNTDSSTDKAIVWLSYNVHGNEASSTEAAMKTLYTLITQKQDWLKNTIVIIDPCINPDGRDRYVNWYNQVKAAPYNVDPAAAEHHEPWPGGRPNHYLFDLNRDWAWATQVETQARLKAYNAWMPHIHVDFHEQYINDPYYFAPAAEPFHEIITPFQRDFQTRIGKNNAKYFDQNGWLYFTGERFDLLYPSYGDTYPTYMGAIGMTYEQAGHGMAGLGIQTNEAAVLTLKDRLEHHFTTGISTVEVASQNSDELSANFRKYFETADSRYKSYALSGNADRLQKLTELLDRHEITYSYKNSGKLSGYNYQQAGNQSGNFEKNTLVVSTNQPKGKMVKVLFEPQTKLTDSVTYDITAWSLPYAYGLNTTASTSTIQAGENANFGNISNTVNPSGVGYLSKWNSMNDAAFLAALLQQEIKVRFSETTFSSQNEQFEPGSLVILKSDNMNLQDFDEKVVSIANEHKRKLTNAATGFSTSGPDFGSSSISILNPQKVALLKGDGVSSLNFGEIWYYFEQDLQYPVTPVDTDYFSSVDLDEFDVLIMPSGRYRSLLNESNLEKISSFVKKGGNLIVLEDAIAAFEGKEGFGITKNEQAKKDSTKVELIPYAQRERESIKDLITGSIIRTKIDNTHPLAFGYPDTYFSLKLTSDSYAFLKNGNNVGVIQQPEVVSGFAGSNAIKNLKNSLVFGEQPMGRGSIIYLVDNPLFRAFWENGKLFFANAVFFTNKTGYSYN